MQTLDITHLITIAAVVIANIGTMLGLFMWATTRADLACQNIREDNKQYSRETQAILKGIADEMKDFHGRLCAIEERNKPKII
jgi:hypothetical protein